MAGNLARGGPCAACLSTALIPVTLVTASRRLARGEGDCREVRRRHVISVFPVVGRCLRPCAGTTPGAARSIATHARYCTILCELVAPRGWYRSSPPPAVDASAPAAAAGRTCGNIRRAR